ncbi:hypothetical protein KLP40_14765 [Hymenobacter sp. NST-14]|uniref:hypothetical protein n=1 Tax=Hymenobacter piscis TaxID=2839984 RepID=UPI001C017462|nr:hypothetical protein [Hymenobacter piscis]MBT9394431.1 hypothetical protein [Hymenobacter piscis]
MKRTFTHRPSISERARTVLVLGLVGLMMTGALITSYETAGYLCLLLAGAAWMLSQLLGDKGFLILAAALLLGSLVLFTSPSGRLAAQLSALL